MEYICPWEIYSLSGGEENAHLLQSPKFYDSEFITGNRTHPEPDKSKPHPHILLR